jgi:curved DNA-binding protein CbpA
MTAPSATGKLADTPLAHALVYARNRRLSGRLELSSTNGQSANLTLWRGRIAKVDTTPQGLVPGGFLGVVAYELGFIDAPMLDSTLAEIAKSKRLHGEVLIERKAITADQRDHALVEQIHRKVHWLFSLDNETSAYSFYDAKEATNPPISVDLVGPVWRGIRDYPPLKFVAETMRRVADHKIRIAPGGDAHSRPRLPMQEASLIEALAKKSMTTTELKAATDLPAGRVDLLVYLLVIAKYIEAESGVRTHPSTGALPINMPSGPVKAPGHISSTKIQAQRVLPDAKAIATPAHAFSPSPTPTLSSLGTVRTPAELGLDGITARAGALEKEDYFQVLGIPDNATVEAVRAAYIRLAKTWHPDKLHSDFFPARNDVAKIFSYMTEAQKTLLDPELRRAYLSTRKPREPAKASRTRPTVLREVQAAFAGKQFDAVAKLTHELITMNADDAEAIALQGWGDVRAGDASDDELRTALVKMDRAVNVDGSSAAAHFYRGLVHKRMNNPSASFRDFARTVTLDPEHADAEREVRLFAMRAKKGSGEHKLALELLQRLERR